MVPPAGGPSRRSFLTGAIAVAAGFAGALVPGSLPLFASVSDPAAGRRPRRELAFLNTHTGEEVSVAYRAAGGGYLPDGRSAIDHVLRDHRTGEVRAIDAGLLDLLADLREALGSSAPYHVISGYRSPATNAMLAAHSRGVSPHSLHMDGLAVDVALPGIALATVREAALDMRAGGVGYYPSPGFVHLDVGRVRRW
jgi:uncharacterized protein YcbK (DUF882 family)